MINIIHEKEPAPGNLTMVDLYAIGTGQVIGAGVITLIVPAMKMTGNSAWLAYLVAILLGFLMISPHLFISSTLRLGGGNGGLISGLAGPYIGGMFQFVFLTQCFGLSMFGTSAAAYLGDVFPALSSPGARVATAVVILTLFYVVNLFGVDVMAKVQKPMTWLLLVSLVLFFIFGLMNAKVNVFDFSDPEFLTQGWGIKVVDKSIKGGFLGAAMLFIFSTNGYSGLTGYGQNARDAKKDAPKALLLIVPTLIVVYCGVAIGGSSCMTLDDYGESTTLVLAAKKVFPGWLYALWIIGGPIMCLATTLNSNFAGRAINIGIGCKNGWYPQWMARKNKNGIYWIGLTYFYVASVVPVMFSLSITVLTNMVQLVMSFVNLMCIVAYFRMPKMYPNAWKRSRFHVPDAVYYMFCCISLGVTLLTIWKSVLSVPLGLAIGNIIVIAVFCAMGYMRAKSKNSTVNVYTAIWSGDDEEDMRADEILKEMVGQQ